MSIEEVSATFEKSYEAGVIPRTQHDSHDPEKNAGEVAGSRSSSTCTGTAQQDESDPEAQEPPSTREEEQTPLPVIVPRSERRGLLAGLTIIPEVEEPKHYPRRRRWFLTFVVAVAAIAAPLGSTILLPSLTDISDGLNSTPTVTNLSIALYLLSLSIFPLWWSFFSETYGRRSVYIVSFTFFVIFNVLTAVSNNIALFLVMRVLAGGSSGSVQAVGAGTIADIWEVKERGRAMGYFYLGPLMGPLLAPVIGGALQSKWGWRSSGWFMVIYGVVTLALLTFCLPETLKSRKRIRAEAEQQAIADGARSTLTRTITRQSVTVKTQRTLRILKMALIDPLLVVRYLRYPAVALCIYYASVTFGSLYVLQVSIQASFEKAPYNFTAIEIGCTYLPNSLGYVLAAILGGKWTDKIMAREARRAKRYDEEGKLVYRPEDRMRENAWLASIVYPVALLWYGWTIQYKVFWLVPLIANFFFGFGTMIIFGLVTTMLTEFMPKKSSSGVALNNFCRNIFSCIGAFVTQPLLTAIGPGWTCTAIAIITGLSSVVIWAMRRYGPQWRKAMDETME